MLLAALLLGSGMTTGMTNAKAQQQTAVTVAVPGGALESALLALGKQAGLKLVYASALTAGKQTSGVSGQLTPEAAVQQLLAGTGLSYSFTSANTVSIFDPAANEAGATIEGAIALDTINVSGGTTATGAGFQGAPDRVYETPASVSVVTREAMKTAPARDTRDLIANAAGVYAGEGNGSFPAVSPNVRGLQDSGRVVVTIDGARQNAQRGMSFGAGMGSYQSNSGQAYVDSAFIREVDIAKTTDAKAGSAASLGGKVDFRTVGAADLIAAGADSGVEINLLRGTNEYDFQGSALAAFRIGENLAVTAGFSKLILGEYEAGTNGEAQSLNAFLGRDTWSSFLKLEFDNHDDVTASLSWMHQDISFAYGSAGSPIPNHEDVRNDNVVAKIKWDPESELIETKASLWLNNSQADELRESRRSQSASAAPDTYIDMENRSFGGVLENTSRLDTGLGALSLNYGAEAFRDQSDSSAMSETIAENPLYATGYTSFSPPGQRDVASGFLNGELKPAEWITVSGGLRYDWSRLKGSQTYYDVNEYTETVTVPCDPLSNHYTAETYWPIFLAENPSWAALYAVYLNGVWPSQLASSCMPGTGTTTSNHVVEYPAYNLDVDRTDGAWLPSATVELKPVDWFRPYASYSESFRPPTILESLIAGGTPGTDGIGTQFAPNVDLRPETGRTYEIGANVIRDGVFRDDDAVRLKAAAFHREIDDYIVMGTIYTEAVESKTYNSFVNMDGETTMRGIELEGNYDMRVAYFGAAATWLSIDWAKKTELFSNGTETTNGDVFAVAGNVPPAFKLTLDGGVRLFDERFTLGARYTYTTPTQARQVASLGADLTVIETTETYSVYDLYGSYLANDNTILRFSVNNVTDERYVPAGGLFLAPGRTATAGIQMKF